MKPRVKLNLCFWTRILTYLLIYGAEAFLRSCQLCSPSGTHQHFMEPEGSIPCPQEPSTGPCYYTRGSLRTQNFKDHDSDLESLEDKRKYDNRKQTSYGDITNGDTATVNISSICSIPVTLVAKMLGTRLGLSILLALRIFLDHLNVVRI
jgi:hypothetical protein